MNTMQVASGLLFAASVAIMMHGIGPRYRQYRVDRSVARWIRDSLR